MNLKEIKDLIEIFNKSEISKLKIKQELFEIELKKTTSLNEAFKSFPMVEMPTARQSITQNNMENPQAQTTQNNTSNSQDYIVSPMVGTFYHCPSPGAEPYIKVGDTIKKGQTVGIVEAMKIMNEIEAEYDCKVIAIEASDSQPVEFGSKLVKVEKI